VHYWLLRPALGVALSALLVLIGPRPRCARVETGAVLTRRCGKVYGRHSNSIDTTRKVCGVCHGALEPLGRFNADGTPAKPRVPSQFSLFVKENFASVRKASGVGTPAEVMKRLGGMWRDQKAAVVEL
jgi:hypothetical protein